MLLTPAVRCWWKGQWVSTKLELLIIACVQLGPRKLSVLWSSGVSTLQRLLKYWNEWKDSRDFHNCHAVILWMSTVQLEGCPLSRVPLYNSICLSSSLLSRGSLGATPSLHLNGTVSQYGMHDVLQIKHIWFLWQHMQFRRHTCTWKIFTSKIRMCMC